METLKDTKPQLLKDVEEFVDYLDLTAEDDQLEELVDRLEMEHDFYVELDGNEYRFIDEHSIWDIYVESVKEMVQDCYDLNVPNWIAINWEETAENCHVDGYGHHFSHYDGSEEEYTFDGDTYYIFRIN